MSTSAEHVRALIFSASQQNTEKKIYIGHDIADSNKHGLIRDWLKRSINSSDEQDFIYLAGTQPNEAPLGGFGCIDTDSEISTLFINVYQVKYTNYQVLQGLFEKYCPNMTLKRIHSHEDEALRTCCMYRTLEYTFKKSAAIDVLADFYKTIGIVSPSYLPDVAQKQLSNIFSATRLKNTT